MCCVNVLHKHDKDSQKKRDDEEEVIEEFSQSIVFMNFGFITVNLTGRFSSSTGTVECDECPPGRWSLQGSTDCSLDD